jgi:PTH1 family peptidyl-tRNA hydrolase
MLYYSIMSYVIAGLGNPGEEYKLTRHNTGRIALEYIAKKNNIEDFKDTPKLKALIAKGEMGNEQVTLVEPNNFMNRSGGSIGPLITSVKKAHNLIVIYDDLDLPLGTIKVSYNRGSGGHRGLESIVKAIKTQEFIRVRIGISPTTPSGKMKKPSAEAVEKHIIGEFKKPELELLKKVSKTVAEAVESIIADGYEIAMGKFN